MAAKDQVEQTAVENENEAEEDVKGKKNVGGVSGPIEFANMLEAAAKAADKPARQFVREIVAKHIGYTGDLGKVVQPRGKAMTKEEKSERNKERRSTFSALLGKYSIDELKALIEKKEEVEAVIAP